MPPIISKDKCKPCGLCAEICPTSVFLMDNPKEFPVIEYPDECWHCNSCVLDCPKSAIELRIPLPAAMLYVDARK